MKKKILLIYVLIFFILNIKTVYATSIVSVNVSDIYKVTGETINEISRYIIDLEKTGTQHGEQNLTIFNSIVPFNLFARRIPRIYNSTGCGACRYSNYPLAKASSVLIENGPERIYIRYENTSSSYPNAAYCWISPEAVCWNWTVDFYLYPRYYLVKYNFWGNFSYIMLPSSASEFIIPYRYPPFFNQSASYFSNGTYHDASITSKTYTDINSSVVFAYNETNHNKTLALFSLGGYKYPASLANNETVWNGFKDQWFDIYYPASVTAINGTYQQRDNITGTYNFTVASNGLLRFNFSTGNYDRTYPVFNIKDAFNVSKYKDHIWYRLVEGDWVKLTNYTDFVIQEGNSTYFGYNYTLLLINKTLASDYEFWISNSSDPQLIPPQYSDSSTNNTLAGQPTLFSLNWTDNVGLSGYIFSTNNAGSWVNDTWIDFENQTGDAIFINSFEEGDFSAWTSIVGSPVINDTDAYHGTYSSQYDTDNEYALIDWTTIGFPTELYTRAYIKFDSLPGSGQFIELAIGHRSGETGYYLGRLGVGYDTAPRWRLDYRSAGSYSNTLSSSGPTTGVWYAIELRSKASSADGELDGEYQVWVDGSELTDVAQTGIDTDSTSMWEVRAGQISSNAKTFYIDRVVVSSSYIGPDTGWSNVTKTLNSTVGTNVQWRVYANDTSDNWNTSQTYSFLTTKITNCNIKGYVSYLDTGELVQSGTLTSIVKETGDRDSTSFSNGYFDFGFYLPPSIIDKRFTLGIIINTSDKKTGYNQLMTSGSSISQTQSCSIKQWYFQGNAIDPEIGQTMSGQVAVSVRGTNYVNTTTFLNGRWGIHISPCLISGGLYTFQFSVVSGDRKTYMFLNQVAK